MQAKRQTPVVAGDRVLFNPVIDVDADVTWDSVRGMLRIDRPEPASAVPSTGVPQLERVTRPAAPRKARERTNAKVRSRRASSARRPR
jgi:hypothetical protein